MTTGKSTAATFPLQTSTPMPAGPPASLGYCGACKYFGSTLSVCRLNPPEIGAWGNNFTTSPGQSLSSPVAMWAKVDPNNDWCGQWKTGP